MLAAIGFGSDTSVRGLFNSQVRANALGNTGGLTRIPLLSMVSEGVTSSETSLTIVNGSALWLHLRW
jgi:hypothetical protein